jgi:hypothetical protein
MASTREWLVYTEITGERKSVAFPLSRAPHESKLGSRRINGTAPATFIGRIAQCATTDEA